MSKDEPYVPKISTKPLPEQERKTMLKRREHTKEKGMPSQKDRLKKYGRELKKLNIHQPRYGVRAENVKAIKEVKEHLRETWQASWDRINKLKVKNLTSKQVEFARQYAKNGRTNKTQAARLAGYDSGNPTVLREMAYKCLAIPHFDELIKAFELEEKARMKLNVEDVVKWFNDIATAAMETGDYTNANRAMENLAKYLQMFTERKEVTHRVVHSREELDTRIAELSRVLKEVEPEIDARLRIN
ncbi:MAG: terminase small subunit [bacterium]